MVKLAALDFPDSILEALRDDRLVIFAGAGVSVGAPSSLDGFWKLAERIAYGTGKTPADPLDRFLGELSHQGVPVHERAREHLTPPNSAPNSLHHDLVRAFRTVDRVKIVTTNYDLHFETAAKAVYGYLPDIYAAPALPLGSDFFGIVHVHGALPKTQNLIMTDADFGRAYLTQGWAKQFLLEVFNHYTVLFIGYSHDDVVMNYLARALPSGKLGRRFALTDTSEKWDLLGITPIIFQKDSGSESFKELYEGVEKLAERATRTALVWRERLETICRDGPPSDEQVIGELDHALAEEYTIRFFTAAAKGPQWVEWLDARSHLNELFRPGQLTAKAKLLATWFAQQVFVDAEKLFEVLAGHELKLNPDLWWQIGREIGVEKNKELGPEALQKWVAILISNAPIDSELEILMWVSERCGEERLFNLTCKIFLFMCKHQLIATRRQRRVPDMSGTAGRAYDVSCEMVVGQWALNEVWENYLQPNIATVAGALFQGAIRCLEDMHHDLLAWNRVSDRWDPMSYSRSAIEAHEQDRNPEAIDVLIDSARDSLEWICRNDEVTAKAWIERLVTSGVPILKRLAVHASAIEFTTEPDQLLDWLTRRAGLQDYPAHHEIFRALYGSFPNASSEARSGLIAEVLSFQSEALNDWSAEKCTARIQFDMLHWLLLANPDCQYALAAVEPIKALYPEWSPSAHPDFTHWSSDAAWVPQQSSWSSEQLLAADPADCLKGLIAVDSSNEVFNIDQNGLARAVTESCKFNSDWGMRLLKTLLLRESFNSHLWPAALRGLSEGALTSTDWHRLFTIAAAPQIVKRHSKPLAELLFSLVNSSESPIFIDVFERANSLSHLIWNALEPELLLADCEDWAVQCMIQPGGIILQFWIYGLDIQMRGKPDSERHLPENYKHWFEMALANSGMRGAYAQCLLAGHFAFLLSLDRAWTSTNVLPMFATDDEPTFRHAWHGFLSWGHLTVGVCLALQDAFSAAFSRMESAFPGQRNRFIEMFSYFAITHEGSPIDVAMPELFKHGSMKDRVAFASHVRYQLRSMSAESRALLWHRWLGTYWQGRLHAIPAPLQQDEVQQMLGWLPVLGAQYPEGVDYIVQSPVISLRDMTLQVELSRSDLVLNYPAATAKLLIFLCKVSKGDYGGLIVSVAKRLSDLPGDLAEDLDEALARVGATR
ncbi:SIR2-like domain-containing protein [Pseudomonas helmanticensis]|uniref:SIR2-like domain-containing protein n=1 Tax=Pseudomonas helmanticensis TaxID=1471381 RepID=A0ACD2UDG0_9PSED|nr:SIR2 family protein [Pseudomonas helmanticensis]SMQ30391.1 SIR2-like domain-containing protein [Pseudomonas helmanticensis]